MKSWPVPSNIKQLRGFLGLTCYYRRFIQRHAHISQPLTSLLKKNAFSWNNEAQTAFEKLQQAMFEALVLALPNFKEEFFIKKEEFVIETDASGQGELLTILTALPSNEFLDAITFMWTIDPVLNDIIENLQAGSLVTSMYTWQVSKRSGENDISMDFVDSLPMSQGKSTFLVVVDRLSKQAHFIAVTHPYTTKAIATLPGQHLQTPWVGLKFSTAYHPQTDGKTENIGTTQIFTVLQILLLLKWCMVNLPPLHIPYMAKDSRVELVDRTLTAREKAIDMLKFNLTKAPNRMKVQADKHRAEREFSIEVFNSKFVNGVFPECDAHGLLAVEPIKILEKKIVKEQNRMGVFGLIQRSNGNEEDAT
ncbi:putative mitochondrial protein [Tanacetum coccineum]